MNITKNQNKLPEIICFCIFIICTVFMGFYHEPWHDEFQAWGISRDTLYNILFVIPHTEGHPQLWHLILKCFSSFNINPELGIRIPNLLFIYTAVFLLLFKSPFSRPVKLALPFTYFLFYQYAVVSRPYSLFTLAMFTSAILYKNRNTNPFKFVLSLILLSFTCAYGMVFSAGIVIVWFIDILKNKKFNIKEYLKDNRIWSMALITFVSLIISIMIFPDKNVLHMSQFSDYVSLKFLYVFFILPLDTLVTNICDSVLAIDSVNLLWCIASIILYCILFRIMKFYKSLLLFFIPFFMFLLTGFNLYIAVHHIGLLAIFYIFVFWCIFDKPQELLPVRMKKIYSILLVITLLIQIYWSIFSYAADYKYDYWLSRKVANYIKKYNLDKYNLMPGFRFKKSYVSKNGNETLPYNITIKNETKESFLSKYDLKIDADYNIQGLPAFINPYFNRNIFYSNNIFEKEKEYVVLKKLSKEELQNYKNEIRKFGLPEILFCLPENMKMIFSDEKIGDTYYIKLKLFKADKVWKDKFNSNNTVIYAREDIYNKLKKEYPHIDEDEA